MVTSTHPPAHHRPGHLGRSPGHRRRARHQPGRPQPEQAPGRDPDLRLPRPGPLPGLPTPDGGPGLRPRPRPVYYQCPHNPARPKDAADHPGHPRTVKAPEKRLDQIVGLFFAEHVFGPRRAELLAAQLPATDAAAAADRDAQAAALTARLKQIDTAQKAQILSLEQLSPDPADTAAAAMRARITDRFAELHHQREQAQAQLGTLAAETPKAADPTLLDELPLAGDILPGLDPGIKARLFAAFDLQILWNKPGRQATVFAEITEATLRALPALLNPGQDGYDDTADTGSGEAADVEDLF